MILTIKEEGIVSEVITTEAIIIVETVIIISETIEIQTDRLTYDT